MKKEHCIFCQRDAIKIVFENDLAVAFWDIHPVNKGHLLVIPKDHKENFFDLSDDELLAIKGLIFKEKELIDKKLTKILKQMVTILELMLANMAVRPLCIVIFT